MRTWLTAAFLGIASFAFFATGITNPGDTLFDEKLYVDAGNAVLAGTTDPSPYGPPLGKLIVAASIHLFGNNAFGWRLPSVVFGALTLVAVFLFIELLLQDYGLAFTGAVLALFNNFLYVFARTAMMEFFSWPSPSGVF